MIKKLKGRQRIQLIACNNINYVYKTEFHLGESAWKWNPTLKSFIYKEISQIHIIRIPAFLLIIGKVLNLIREVMRFRGKVVIVANNLANGKVIERLVKTMRQPALLTKYYAGGLTRKTENLRQYLEADKGLTNLKVRSKYIKQLIGLQDLERKPAYIVILDAIQGKFLINESAILGIPTIGCGDTTINFPKLNYPLIGNFKSREKRGSVLLLIKHAMFEGMRQEATIFAEYYNKYTRMYKSFLK
ncbi:ribosomal protein S2 (mitochondrion) [Dictyostelium discoideum]|uniref:Small ribosomal subunit protein uS2m n=1 Tax=Dictyostelium discoideum TaxID=44689 RepID=RT02_DICDI|nr:ribosomal protein S2 [Dictyostelium discoideum]Q9XPI7.1 RecName: Full=Small ribosomal subunit protein uS2m; AltName: Full=Ribosomal protein S2, mitochondrial; Short=MRP-S2; Short=S2mt [Dictyostelium discoideum]BAA78089.1 ribosomal protein S2 [Dictyostelium discoideum]|eukprot:NP_050107.1 ribosomal protein S2 (mitochondrion) [Dictyostelium discoideum]